MQSMTSFVRPGRPGFASLLATILFLLLTGVSGLPANISLSGSCSWQISGDNINISAARVDNDSTSGTSGSLRLQVWATTSPYAGGSISGYVIGSRPLNPLPASYYYSAISGYVPYRSPPGGTYYTTLTVEEYTGTGYVIRDYLTFNGTSQLGSGGNTTGTIDLVGSVEWSVSGSMINIKATKILNGRSGGTSGTLRLQVWATRSPYSGGTISGYIMGTRVLGTLPAGYGYNNLDGSVAFTAPPAGTYYTTLTLEEYQNGSFVIVDYVTFPSTSTFGPAGGGDETPGGSDAGLEIVGSVKYKLSASKGVATLSVARVKNGNTTPGSISGTLRVRLWATSARYTSGTLNGYVLASHPLGQLNAGYYLNKVKATVAYTHPPSGRYFVVMTLEEYQDGSYTIVDSVNFTKQLKIK